MTSYGDFSSLLQLGVGIGIGLSLFRAPVDLRVSRIDRVIESELVALRGLATPFAKAKRRDIMDLRLRFVSIKDDLNEHMLPFMIAAVFAALLNLAGLITVTLCADRGAGPTEAGVFLFISVGWFLIEIALLEGLAQWTLRKFTRDLVQVRTRKAPKIEIPT
jgi:hypothetical protein